MVFYHGFHCTEVIGHVRENLIHEDLALCSSRSPVNISHHSAGESPRTPHRSLRMVSSELDPRGSHGPLTYGADRDIYNDIDSDLDLAPASRHRNMSEFSDDHSSAASADIVAETKYRLKGLEKEAQVSVVDLVFLMVHPVSCLALRRLPQQSVGPWTLSSGPIHMSLGEAEQVQPRMEVNGELYNCDKAMLPRN